MFEDTNVIWSLHSYLIVTVLTYNRTSDLIDKAEEYVRKAIDLNNTYHSSWSFLGEVLLLKSESAKDSRYIFAYILCILHPVLHSFYLISMWILFGY